MCNVNEEWRMKLYAVPMKNDKKSEEEEWRMKNDKKSEEELTRRFITDIRNLTNFDSSTQKSENLHFNGFFWPKYIMLELRKYREVMFDTTQDWYKICRKTDLCFYKWHVEFGKCSPKYLRISNWDFDDMLLSKEENVWAWIWQGFTCYDYGKWPLREKCPNTELFLVRIFLYSNWIRRFTS